MQDQTDPVGAFLPGPRAAIAGAPEGPLAGLTFAVKDLYDVAGHVTGYGSPDWARTHPVAPATAPCIMDLIAAGASLLGKVKTMELAYGLSGENIWYGTPINPAAPDRFPGGSSCGSAAATAAGLVDFAMGTDTGGSVRVPASYCGIFGIRPSWGSVNLAGACGLGPSFDTGGWFARSATVLAQVGGVLLPPESGGSIGPLLRVQEAWANAMPGVATALLPGLAAAERVLGTALAVQIAPEGLAAFFDNFRCAQSAEAWATLGPWIASTRPTFSPGVKERFDLARDMPPARSARGRAFRAKVQQRLRGLLAGGAIIAYPTCPGPAPRLDADPGAQHAMREATMAVTAIAGLAGLCEVTIPMGRHDGAPVGLSLVAAPGRDRALLELAIRVAAEAGLPG
jgi:amidase